MNILSNHQFVPLRKTNENHHTYIYITLIWKMNLMTKTVILHQGIETRTTTLTTNTTAITLFSMVTFILCLPYMMTTQTDNDTINKYYSNRNVQRYRPRPNQSNSSYQNINNSSYQCSSRICLEPHFIHNHDQ